MPRIASGSASSAREPERNRLAEQAPGGEQRDPVAETDFLENIVQRGTPGFDQQLFDGLRLDCLEASIQAEQRLVEQSPTQVNGLGLLLSLEEVANIGARLGGYHGVEPARVGMCAGRGDDLQGLPALQRGAERCEVAVDPAGNAAVAYAGMHGIGKIDRRGAVWQRQDVALGVNT